MLNGNIRRNQGESSCLDANVDAEPLEIKTGAKVHRICTVWVLTDDVQRNVKIPMQINWLDHVT